MNALETHLREVRASGRTILIPYLVAGLDDEWLDCVRAAIHAGADAVEIGVPFSDPVMDGAVIQNAATASLARGTTLSSVVRDVGDLDADVPLIAMTYLNIVHRAGYQRAAGQLRAAGIDAAIIPDAPLEEVTPWREAANAEGLDVVQMVAPSTPLERARRLAQSSQGFAYAAARMAVTGKSSLSNDAKRVVENVRSASDIPVCVGIGIANAEQASEAASFSDGVIVGSALVQRVLEGEGPRGVEDFVGELRAALS